MTHIFGWQRSILAAVVLTGCGGSHTDNENSSTSGNDAGLIDAGLSDAEAPDDAEAQAIPQFTYGLPTDGGALPGLLSSLQIVTATWNGDTEDIRADIAKVFSPELGNSAWWKALSKTCVPGTTFCVNTTVTVTTSRIGDAPGTPVVDSALAQNPRYDTFARFIRDKSQPGTSTMNDGGSKLPAPVTASTLYVFFMPLALPANAKGPGLPPGWTMTVDGAPTCGYHSAITGGVAQAPVAYVVVP